MVRISGIDPTRPAREMQSGIRCRSALACSCTIATQHNPSNTNRLQATRESVLPPELHGSPPGTSQALVVATRSSTRPPDPLKELPTSLAPAITRAHPYP